MRLNAAALSLVLCAACGPKVGPPGTDAGGFDDHTVGALATVEQFHALAAVQPTRWSGKFTITRFGTAQAETRWYDNAFFSLHDEWYWFRLLNGQPVPGDELAQPVEGQRFPTIASIYEWAKPQASLPLDLRWADGERLYSPRFYDLALFAPPRVFGLGTLLHVKASAKKPERWAFQLEFVDVPTHGELVSFFEALERTVPLEVRGKFFWVVRSPAQEQLATQMEAAKLPFHDRILRMKDLTNEGETEVYSQGLTAGRLRLIRSGQPLTNLDPADILVLEDVPDYLPPTVGVVTAVPQTPLAHFNLLARNRGIPNAYRGGILDDASVTELAALHAPVVLQAKGSALILKAITEAQLAQWQALQKKTPVAVTQVDAGSLPYTYDLRTLSLADADALRPAVGGKSAGYLGLLAGAPEATPDRIVGISIRPYVEHLAPHKARIEAMLARAEFVDDARVRYATLEGEKDFREDFPTAESNAWLTQFLNEHAPGDLLGDLIRADGLKGVLRKAKVEPTTLATLTQVLQTQFGHYAPTQGLRFRSSSTAEDVEGFNGAGLYDSNTGFLDATQAVDPDERNQTVEWALKKTWASYWSAEAFEERRHENIDHLSGNMGVVVHARFDDALEKSNGVFLLTVQPGRVTMELDVQVGALSVTNPTTTALPEISRVTLLQGESTPIVERLRASTVAPAGTQVLTDAELLETFARARAVAQKWLENDNATRPAAQAARTLVLDFEFRQVPMGWPALASGSFPARIVLKQSRTLDPGIRGLSSEVKALPLPHDVLSRARRIERRTCTASSFTATLVEALTDPLKSPDLGYAQSAFTASLGFAFTAPVPEIERTTGDALPLEHLQLLGSAHTTSGSWGFTTQLTEAARAQAKLKSVYFGTDGSWRLEGLAQTAQGAGLTCTVEVLFSTPNEYLLSLL